MKMVAHVLCPLSLNHQLPSNPARSEPLCPRGCRLLSVAEAVAGVAPPPPARRSRQGPRRHRGWGSPFPPRLSPAAGALQAPALLLASRPPPSCPPPCLVGPGRGGAAPGPGCAPRSPLRGRCAASRAAPQLRRLFALQWRVSGSPFLMEIVLCVTELTFGLDTCIS